MCVCVCLCVFVCVCVYTNILRQQAENDVLAKKNRSLEAEIAAVREEKRRIQRQLSLTIDRFRSFD